MTITPLPLPPSRQDPANFSSRSDAFLGALPTFATEANALATEVNNDAIAANDAATTATTQAGIATTQANLASTKAAEASASALSALNAPGTSSTSSTTLTISTGLKTLTTQTGKSYVVGMSVVIASNLSPDKRMTGFIQSYDAISGTIEVQIESFVGSGTFSSWSLSVGSIAIPAASQAEMEAGTEIALRSMSPNRIAQAISALGKSKITREAITANKTLSPSDFGKIIDFTGSSNATLTFPPASTLGNGWNCILRNSGTGDLLMGEEVIGPELIVNGDLSTNIVGANVVVNGDFATGSDWTSSAGWTISAGVATATVAQNLTANADPLTVGTWYLVTYTVVTRTAGTVNIRLGETMGLDRTTTGTYTEILQCVGTGELRIQGNGTFRGSVDNVIVRPYNAGWIVGGNVLFNPSFENSGEGWQVSGTGAAVTFADGSATFTAGTNIVLELDGYTANSTAYRVSFTVSNYTSGTITPSIHGANGTAVNANGNYVQYITASTSLGDGFQFTGSFRGTISNVVVSRRVESSAVPVTYDGTNFELDISSLTVDTVAGPEQIIPALVAGGIYELTYEVKNWTGGGIAAHVGANVLTTRSANGTYTERFIAKGASARIQFVAKWSAFTGSIDNVSLRRITATATAPDTDVTTSPWRMYSGEVRLLQSDGTTLRTVVLNPFYKAFTQSGPFIKPPGYTLFQGLLWGAGAAGGNNSPGSGSGTGGGGGGCAPFFVHASAVPSLTSVLIGSGGLPSSTTSVRLGGASTAFGVTAQGGGLSSASNLGGAAYSLLAATVDLGFGTANDGINNVYGGAGANASSVYGGGGGGDGVTSTAGTSVFGGSGGAGGANSQNGQPGIAPGGGGGGGAADASVSRLGGAGARGELRIWGVV